MDSQASIAELGQHLKQLLQTAVVELPDLYQMAHDTAQHLLQSMGLVADPDTLYWHRFRNSQSSHRTFTGFEHVGPPVESMTFTELLMRRFRVGDQDNADLLHQMGGFYHADATARFYDEHNEARLAPAAVMKALWQTDFSAMYHPRIKRFWDSHTDAVRSMIRLNCLCAAVQACQDLELRRAQVQWVYDGLGVARAMAPTVADFMGERPALAGVSVRRVRIAGHDLINVLCFAAPTGGRLLYLAGRQAAFEGFASDAALQAWLHGELGYAQGMDYLLLHTALVGAADAVLRRQAFEALGAQPLGQARAGIECLALAGDAGSWLCEQTRLQMAAEADLRLRGNDDLRKQLWVGYLGAGLRVLGPSALVAWPLALVVVVASASKFALHVDRAVNANDPAQRQAALLAAIFSGVELLLNATLLLPGAIPSLAELEPLEALPRLTPRAPALPEANGIVSVDGLQYVRLDGRFYRVRHDSQMQCWLIVDPKRPYGFGGNHPVRFNEQLQWELLDPPCLRGGGGCLGTARVTPALPDDYEVFDMQTRLYETPLSARVQVRELYRPEFKNLLAGLGLETGHRLESALATINRLRGRLVEDAVAFIEQWRANPRPRSSQWVPDSSLSVPLALQRLLQQSRGVVIGESHIAIASKRLLIENMQAMVRNGVDTLYMEHLLSDLHQEWLENLPRSGKLPAPLQDYLRALDQGHGLEVSSEYSFTRLVQVARREGVEVRALDCAASYRLDGMDEVFEYVGGTMRQQVFSYYASRVFAARRAAGQVGKWVALVGNTHASTYKGVPGLAQLEDVMSIRVVDAGEGQQTGMTLDPGEFFLPSMGRPDGVVKADWRLALKVREAPYEFLDPSLAPPGVTRP
ncbi:membrane-targeted effector domain-containing toxin [Pseudomonas sp. HR96]|uniref:membrane-targeted effector domain-containing toxin n=1 Tax=Pseudomonas sp. HR96 TaxID=1027966 RepID=UPI002A754776|nr:membrane-targeted effector domain-containing toxin [Pseudomonas sp. HR96]WPP00852.1 membrane-targeted effector domain-containing toxin [Pseudomonas sp. HR96]